ncbi:twin-arginine translocase subunit TatC [Gallaecimonas mangrovi]|uniref:twin-arginine translocase subunit TatC n=1 Tax=Gallaecimonas mangrovi TaxID=2291597 RepID=UPI000E20B031|nr:twin-arginine translocase subunit TatC [Gallaecimonas mangrovi]
MSDMPLLAHLLELRTRILRALIAVGLVLIVMAYFAKDLYHNLALPLLSKMPAGTSMIATDVASPFFVPFKLALVLSFFVAMPAVLYQVWAFVAPGLYKHERRLIAPLLAMSSLLFYGGIAFAYFVVFPVIFTFFTSVAPQGVTIATDISSYLDFVLKLFFAFGVAFEIPIAVTLLCYTGAVEVQTLAKKRPYIIVIAFALGMLLTPPDVISQTLLAVPMWLLFELGLVMARMVKRRRAPEDEEEEAQ